MCLEIVDVDEATTLGVDVNAAMIRSSSPISRSAVASPSRPILTLEQVEGYRWSLSQKLALRGSELPVAQTAAELAALAS